MKHLLSKKVSKSRDDVKGYGCWIMCDAACSGSCANCTGGCSGYCDGSCGSTCHMVVTF